MENDTYVLHMRHELVTANVGNVPEEEAKQFIPASRLYLSALRPVMGFDSGYVLWLLLLCRAPPRQAPRHAFSAAAFQNPLEIV
jgi:hypothetical protein